MITGTSRAPWSGIRNNVCQYDYRDHEGPLVWVWKDHEVEKDRLDVPVSLVNLVLACPALRDPPALLGYLPALTLEEVQMLLSRLDQDFCSEDHRVLQDHPDLPGLAWGELVLMLVG